VLGDEQGDGVPAEGAASTAGEERGAWFSSTLGQPDAKDAARLGGERRDPFLAAFAVAAQVGAGAEVHVCAREGGELADAQAGLDGDQEQRMVAAASPSLAQRGGRKWGHRVISYTAWREKTQV